MKISCAHALTYITQNSVRKLVEKIYNFTIDHIEDNKLFEKC